MKRFLRAAGLWTILLAGLVLFTEPGRNTAYAFLQDFPVATTSLLGAVKPDGTTISVAADGTIAAVGAAPTAAAWTPTDASGAALTFTNVSAKYVQIGPMVFAWASLTYPSTADGSNAAIGGLPVTVANYTGAQASSIIYGIVSVPISIQPQANTVTAFIWVNNQESTRKTNSLLSGSTVSFLLIYPAS